MPKAEILVYDQALRRWEGGIWVPKIAYRVKSKGVLEHCERGSIDLASSFAYMVEIL